MKNCNPKKVTRAGEIRDEVLEQVEKDKKAANLAPTPPSTMNSPARIGTLGFEFLAG